MLHPLKQVSRPKQKKIGQDAVASSYKTYFIVKNKIILLMQKNGLVYHFSSCKSMSFTFVQVIMHQPLIRYLTRKNILCWQPFLDNFCKDPSLMKRREFLLESEANRFSTPIRSRCRSISFCLFSMSWMRSWTRLSSWSI